LAISYFVVWMILVVTKKDSTQVPDILPLARMMLLPGQQENWNKLIAGRSSDIKSRIHRMVIFLFKLWAEDMGAHDGNNARQSNDLHQQIAFWMHSSGLPVPLTVCHSNKQLPHCCSIILCKTSADAVSCVASLLMLVLMLPLVDCC